MSLGIILTLIFMVLKLTGYISWPWLGVLLPVIIELAVDVFLFILFMILKPWR